MEMYRQQYAVVWSLLVSPQLAFLWQTSFFDVDLLGDP